MKGDISAGLSLIITSKVSSFFNKLYQTTNILIDGSLEGGKSATGEHACASEITFHVGAVRQTKAPCYGSKLVASLRDREAKQRV